MKGEWASRCRQDPEPAPAPVGRETRRAQEVDALPDNLRA